MKQNYLKIITINFKKTSEKLMELYLGLDLSRFAPSSQPSGSLSKISLKSGLKSGLINY